MECLELIYSQYEREISYCIPRNQIRDALAIYLMENHVSLDVDQETGPIKNHGELDKEAVKNLVSMDEKSLLIGVKIFS